MTIRVKMNQYSQFMSTEISQLTLINNWICCCYKVNSYVRERTYYLIRRWSVSQVSKSEKPQHSYLKRLREWLNDRKGGLKAGVFEHPEIWVWEEKDHRDEPLHHDFVTLAPLRVERDYFTRGIIYPLVSIFHHIWDHKQLDKRNVLDLESRLVEYDEERIDRIGMVISTILASMFPIIAVLGLFFVKNPLNRIYIMIRITGGFAGLLALLSNGKGKRIEIFATKATAVLMFQTGRFPC